VPACADMRSTNPDSSECRRCSVFNLCLWCPAQRCTGDWEHGRLVEYFCESPMPRAAALQGARGPGSKLAPAAESGREQ